MSIDLDETIAAISTASGPSFRSIIRISGIDTLNSLVRTFEMDRQLIPCDRPSFTQHSCFIPVVDRKVTFELAVWPDDRSFTRQPMAEIHCIGSPPIVQAILRHLNQSGVRSASPGEFTMRAFLAGRIDLTQAAAILGVIDARTNHEMQISLRQLAGGMSSKLRVVQDELLNALADIEAGLDFVEDDIEFISNDQVTDSLNNAIVQIDQIVTQLIEREVSRSEFRVVIFGQPNVGKSSLFNALCESVVSNIDSQAGTTRDFNVAEISLSKGDQLDGDQPNFDHSSVNIQLVDTAGIQSGLSPDADDISIEQLAQSQTQLQIAESHLRILCLDGSRDLDRWERETIATEDLARLIVNNKIDLPPVLSHSEFDEPPIRISCEQGIGLEELRGRIADRIVQQLESLSGQAATAGQCLSSLSMAKQSLVNAGITVEAKAGHEVVAGEIRIAVENIGIVTGTIHTDDILDRIFGRFCIGK